MATLSRLAFAFGAPAIIMASALGVVWVSTSRVDTMMGPSRPVLYTPPSEPPSAPQPEHLEAPAPPPNIDEATPTWQAQVRNALIPFTKAPHLTAARVAAAADREAPAAALQCLASAVYYEAGAEPEAGKRAVAQVVINRWASPAFPKTICNVIRQGAPTPGCQFSFMCDGALARRPSPAGWADAEMVARAALNGYVETSVGAATHYHADYVVPVWAATMLKLVKLGRHIFYRWPGANLSRSPGAGEAIAPPAPPAAAFDAFSAAGKPVSETAPASPSAQSSTAQPSPSPPSDSGDTAAASPKNQAPERMATPLAAPLSAAKPRPEPEPRQDAPHRPIPPPSLRVGPL
jgi:spore germination cell wall hydrolase CwlJ-like protein